MYRSFVREIFFVYFLMNGILFCPSNSVVTTLYKSTNVDNYVDNLSRIYSMISPSAARFHGIVEWGYFYSTVERVWAICPICIPTHVTGESR